MDPSESPPRQDPQNPSASRRERFFASTSWLILKNVLGWMLILAALLVGPLVPGPGGIPLFLIGFALISFPGKRRLTARILRGKRVRIARRHLALVSLGLTLIASFLAWLLFRNHPWRNRTIGGGQGPLWVILGYLALTAAIWGLVYAVPPTLNACLWIMARARRRFRPWLRRHHIRLLPPRRRRRRPHEPGHGPLRLKDEILKFVTKAHRRRPES
jgi:hypothetical protein